MLPSLGAHYLDADEMCHIQMLVKEVKDKIEELVEVLTFAATSIAHGWRISYSRTKRAWMLCATPIPGSSR